MKPSKEDLDRWRIKVEDMGFELKFEQVIALLDLVEQEQKSYGICIDALKAIKERAKGNASLPTIIERVDQALAAMEKIE